jgi:hypothetical protein
VKAQTRKDWFSSFRRKALPILSQTNLKWFSLLNDLTVFSNSLHFCVRLSLMYINFESCWKPRSRAFFNLRLCFRLKILFRPTRRVNLTIIVGIHPGEADGWYAGRFPFEQKKQFNCVSGMSSGKIERYSVTDLVNNRRHVGRFPLDVNSGNLAWKSNGTR